MPKQKKEKKKRVLYPEARFHKWFLKNAPDRFREVESEIPIYSAYACLAANMNEDLIFTKCSEIKKKAIGRIDLIFEYYRVNYCCEIKYTKMGQADFWDALKVVGYTSYYNWVTNRSHKPAIMCPEKHLKLEHYIIANALKIKLFAIIKVEDNYIIKEAKYEIAR